MEFFMAASLAVFLSVPVGPIGIAAGERLLLGGRRDFLLIALGCILADVLWAVSSVLVMMLFPTFDITWVYHIWQPWVVIGGVLVALGFYLLRQRPEAVGKAIHRHALAFGFVGTFLWPTTFTGIFGAFAGAHLAGWLPMDAMGRVGVALSLGVGTAAMWFLWWTFFTGLRLLREWLQWDWLSVKHLAWFFHGAMSVALILGGVGILLKPVLV